MYLAIQPCLAAAFKIDDVVILSAKDLLSEFCLGTNIIWSRIKLWLYLILCSLLSHLGHPGWAWNCKVTGPKHLSTENLLDFYKMTSPCHQDGKKERQIPELSSMKASLPPRKWGKVCLGIPGWQAILTNRDQKRKFSSQERHACPLRLSTTDPTTKPTLLL